MTKAEIQAMIDAIVPVATMSGKVYLSYQESGLTKEEAMELTKYFLFVTIKGTAPDKPDPIASMLAGLDLSKKESD